MYLRHICFRFIIKVSCTNIVRIPPFKYRIVTGDFHFSLNDVCKRVNDDIIFNITSTNLKIAYLQTERSTSFIQTKIIKN